MPKDSFENNNFAMHNVGIIQHIPRCLGNIETRKDAKKTEEFLQHPSVITTENTSITSTTSSTSTISWGGMGERVTEPDEPWISDIYKRFYLVLDI